MLLSAIFRNSKQATISTVSAPNKKGGTRRSDASVRHAKPTAPPLGETSTLAKASGGKRPHGPVGLAGSVASTFEKFEEHRLRKNGFEQVKMSLSSHGKSYEVAFWDAKGNGPLPTLVVCHGVAGSTATYRAFLEGIRPSFKRVISIDVPGHGASEPLGLHHGPPPETPYEAVGRMSDLINQGLDRLIEPNEVVFGVGHSLGGYVLDNYALHGKTRANVHGLVGVSPDGAKFSDAELKELHELMSVGDSFRKAYKMAKRTWPGEKFKAMAMAPFLQAFFHSPAIEYVYNSDMLQPSLTPDEMKKLPPMCLMWGTREALLPASNLEYFKAHLPADRTTFLSPKNMAHGSLPDGPKELVDPIVAYFTSIYSAVDPR